MKSCTNLFNIVQELDVAIEEQLLRLGRLDNAIYTTVIALYSEADIALSLKTDRELF